MSEIRSALIMSTIAIILAFGPMFFITGMMGPYMAPMAFNVPVSVTVSTLVAFLVTPWLAYKLLRRTPGASDYDVRRTLLYRGYSRVLRPLLRGTAGAWLFLSAVALVFLLALSLPALRLVPLKLLPYDNKNEFQLVVDMPEGTTLERTAAVTRAFAEYLRSVPEVAAFAAFVGQPSPMDFNGMVRHYYLREGPQYADLRVTLADRLRREQQSHELLLRIRKDLQAIAQRHGAALKLVETPPGPPVIATLTVELYGTETTPYRTLQQAALQLAERLGREPFVVDVDTSVEANQSKLTFITDQEKAALSGIATEDIVQTLELAVGGMTAAYLQQPDEANPLPIILRLPLARRDSESELATLTVKGRPGISKIREKDGVRDAPQPLVQLGELGRFEQSIADQTRYRKNLRPVAYVFAELAGRPPGEAIVDTIADRD